MQNDYQIILASASPRRAELLKQIAVKAKVQAVDIDENQKPDEAVLDYVQRLAMEKAECGFIVNTASELDRENVLPVLGSDTIIEIDGSIIGKPKNRQHAKQILQNLSEKKHLVHTSVAIVMSIGADTRKLSLTSTTEVFFEALAEKEIDNYLATGEADDKAGAYAIQGIAAQFVKRINGSYSGVMGLPLYETAQLLKQCGVRGIFSE